MHNQKLRKTLVHNTRSSEWEHNPQVDKQDKTQLHYVLSLHAFCSLIKVQLVIMNCLWHLYNYQPKKGWCYIFNFQYADEVKKPPRSLFGFSKMISVYIKPVELGVVYYAWLPSCGSIRYSHWFVKICRCG